ncbi:sensor histidine kinase [Portibacter lacus]|uniref:Signal transduction histidine kinase internal region domain-containing protein n=1 Tax=Portibacter lacus TaxID=1099794 RepID=A0AA37SUQ5_9BACT|nr:sensor histidine kinase [Portibacter lacus]GLR18573.1 hypothetical protein GCM10007940_31890 [Portibacter lacus]
MANSKDGYLYIGGPETVYRFDGKNSDPIFQDFNLPFSEIDNLVEVGRDSLFLMTNGKLILYGQESPIVDETINAYALYRNKIFYGTDNGVKFYDRDGNYIDRPIPLLKLENIKINDLVISDHFLYIASEKGFYKYDIENEKLENYNLTEKLDLQKIKIDQYESMWSYDLNGTVFNIDLKNKTYTPYYNEGFQINNLAIDSSDRVWIGTTNKGILRHDLRKQSWKTIDQRSGLSDNRITEIIVDHWGMVWIATADQMLAKFIDRDYELFNVYDGLVSDDVSAIYAQEDRLLFSAGNKGVYAYQNRKITTLIDLDVKCESIYADSLNLWVGTNGNGILRLSNNETTTYRKAAGIPSEWINHIVKDQEENIWISTFSNGIANLIQRDSSTIVVRKFGKEEGLQDLNISAILASSSGVVYYGTQSGSIGAFYGKVHQRIPSEGIISSTITDIIQGPNNEIFFASLNNGVFELKQNEKKGGLSKIEHFPESVKALALKGNEVWAANDKGVYKDSLSFTTGDGFPSNKIIAGGMVEYQDRIWIASPNGIISIGDLASARNERVPLIHFKDVQANYNPIPISRGSDRNAASIDYNENQISFEYEGVDIHSTKDLNYSYILEGRDKDWSPWTKNDNPSFSNLSAGSYAFKVRAKSDDDAISAPISYTFVINGPIWKKWWFFPSIAIVIGLLVFALFRRRIRNIKKKNEEEKAQLELKNKLLELEQKANQLQMNPHFIFNALNSIQATVAKEDYKDARREITDFATLMRSILSNSKERVITLQDELQLLKKYIDIEKKCRTLDFEYEIDIQDKIDVAEALIPPMLIQPFVENAIVHGIQHSQAGKLQLNFKLLLEDIMEVRIIDNGIGYETSKKKSVRKKHKSIAIDVTKERLETLLPIKYHPVIKINQISKEGGTEVVIRIPVEYNF